VLDENSVISNHRLVTIAIDAPNNDLLKQWISQGLLPNIAQLISEGYQRDLFHKKYYRNDSCWSIFTQSNFAGDTGFNYFANDYRFEFDNLDAKPQKAFYSLDDKKRVCTFDLPVPFAKNLNGIQIHGWASELSSSVAQSIPPELIDEIHQTYGGDARFDGIETSYVKQGNHTYKSYPLPSVYDEVELNNLADRLITSVHRRAEICCDLLSRESWDLFLSCFSESHTANHLLWHIENSHPIAFDGKKRSPILEITQAIDNAIGKIKSNLSESQSLVVFTIDHVAQNSMDTPSMVFLPELLFRWCFNGKAAIASEDINLPVRPIESHFKSHWKYEVAKLLTPLGQEMLLSPTYLDSLGDPLSWNPASWYRDCWPYMSAFALPSVSDGYIRLNVKGREKSGVVEPSQFQYEVNRLIQLISTALDSRTGLPVVAEIIQVRNQPSENPHLSPDLIICWQPEATDVIDVPGFGRIGPIPFFRTGGHVLHGTDITNFFVASGPAAALLKSKSNSCLPIELNQFSKLLLSLI